MQTGTIYVIIFGILLIAAIVLGVIITNILKKAESIELIQGKLENSDLSIAKAMKFLQITNEWSQQDVEK